MTTITNTGVTTTDLTVDTNTIKVDSTNNRVGIGTTSPGSKLHIQETASAGTGILLTNNNNTAGTYSDLKWQYSAGDSSYASGLRFKQVDTTHGGQIEFYTDNPSGTFTKQMEITENGHVTMPNQPMLALQPDSTGNNTVPSSQSNYTHIVGWKVVGGRQTFLRSGLTLSGTTHGYYLANGNNTGRITFSTAGIYYFDCTIRIENQPGAGNIYVRFNGSVIHRMHVEAWGRYPYAHGRASRCVSASAGDYIEFGVACPTGGFFSGSGDTVNWLTIMKVA